jgi:hypothetical protein
MFDFLRNLLRRMPPGLALWRLLQFPYPYRIALVELLLIARPRLRPHYWSALYEAALLAKKLGYPSFSAIEFGVAGGNGLLALEGYARRLERRFGLTIEIYGFDRVSGLGEPADWRDIPYAWKPGYFAMEPAKLKPRLGRARLVEGDIAETAPRFFAEVGPAPIGCVFVDVDYFSSTKACLTLFDAGPETRLPRVPCYFDDLGNGNRFTGEFGAIRDFNARHDMQKLARNDSFYDAFLYGRRRDLVFVLHDFAHSKYGVYTGFAEHTYEVERIRL